MLRTVPRTVWAAMALFGLLGIGWTLIAPLGRAPDEPAHADLVFLMATGAHYPDYDARSMGAGPLAAAFAYTPGFDDGSPGSPWLLPEDAPDRGDRPTLHQWGGLETVDFNNAAPQHPPLYYWTLGSALRLERWVLPGDPAPLDREWHELRLANVLLVLPIPLLCWAAARRLGVGDTVAEIAALVPLCIPQLSHIGASINNDNLLVLLSGVVAVMTAAVVRGDRSPSTGLTVGVAVGLALFAKQFALVLVPWVVLAYAYAAWRDGRLWRPAGRALAISLVPMAVIGGYWPLRNLLRHGTLLPSAADGLYYRQRVPGFHADVLAYAREYTSSMVRSFWGDFGWLEVRLSTVLIVLATALAVAGAVVALWGPRSPDAAGVERATAGISPSSRGSCPCCSSSCSPATSTATGSRGAMPSCRVGTSSSPSSRSPSSSRSARRGSGEGDDGCPCCSSFSPV